MPSTENEAQVFSGYLQNEHEWVNFILFIIEQGAKYVGWSEEDRATASNSE